ncbi:MAG: tyrosine-type recombinase/integrase [Desulforhopalus sp.]|nr:tyrosine-type recombinase/integrase [Desulforhopalus sp.]
MTVSQNLFESFYPNDWIHSVQSSNHSFIFPLHDHAKSDPVSMRKLFAPSAGAFYVYRPSKRRRALNRAIDNLEQGNLPGYEYAISHVCDKYRRNLTISTISQTGRILVVFLSFIQDLGRLSIEDITRKDIADYVEHLHDRGLVMTSVKNYLLTVYAFIRYLVDNKLLPLDILRKKIRIKLPEVLPRAIPAEDLQQILAVITPVRDRALILLLLHTGMRIGELLRVKIADIILPERKILLYLGEKNFQGRIVYFSSDAEQALKKWLEIRDSGSEYLFYGYAGQELSHVGAWMIMRKALRKTGLEHRGYSLHSLRHTFATNMLNAGLRLEVLQQLLGHLSIEITLRYAKVSNITRENEFFKAMAIIEKGGNHEHDRVNSELQAVFKEKELLGAHY